ncbi:ABC transporter ATP-binding protein [Anaerocolumna sp. AGMB13020]|uniref:ABC transporter ATP-binding protein n=1 Tax=Anaerocolumna sp. AGMB13020 TaxID=3081750 RepID=UPI002952B936|nr:ABC transporter ATP-binding protein [Anaerocolumna sp. AGMB13020]WOO37198.1 ABC transporter ATP-binding protein [Anaerocolumna sp. AGMB13020]
MKHIITYLRPYGLRMLMGFIIKVAGTFMDLGLPWVLAYIIDEVIPLKEVKYILLWGVLMLLLSVGARQFNITANRMASRVAGDTVKKLRHDLFLKIQQLSGSQVDYLSIPSLVSRMTSDTYNIHQMVGMMQRLGVRAPIILVGGMILTFTLEPVLTLILVGILPLLAYCVYVVSKKGIPLYSKSQSSADKMVRVVRENVNGIRVIKALSKSVYEKERFHRANDEVAANEFKAGATMAVINPIMNLLLNGGLTLVIIAGAYRVNSGASEVGKIVAFLSYFTMILNAMLMITRIFVGISKANASADRIFEVLNAKEELKPQEALTEKEVYGTSEIENIHVSFRGVTFTYPQRREEEAEDDDSINVENIDFGIKTGESLGIIGATGSGKTTLINLLLRFYDTDKGGIYIKGKNVKSYSLQELRSKFGVVFQNDMIFADTIGGNIDFNRGLSADRLKEAAEDAQALEFIDHLVNGEKCGFDYEAAVKGANLSGGQKQRLLLARALAARPEILVFDDSSSALDYKTDAALRTALRDNYQNTTTIMIAQRISSIMNMDHIIVMEEGRMIGYGKHEELLLNCSVYNEIYQSQMGE